MEADIVQTRHGEMRTVLIDGRPAFKLKCPGCGQWGELDSDQLFGRVSVDHTDTGCTYHETHDFADAIHAAEAGCAWDQRKQTDSDEVRP